MKKLFGVLAMAMVAASLMATQASALWVSQATVARVRTYTNSDRIDIWFNVDVTTGCTGNNDKVSVDSSYVTSAERRERILRTALAARMSGKVVEVNTLAGCSNSYGKLEYLSLK